MGNKNIHLQRVGNQLETKSRNDKCKRTEEESEPVVNSAKRINQGVSKRAISSISMILDHGDGTKLKSRRE